MLKLTVTDIQEARTVVHYGSERELLDFARQSFEVGEAEALDEVVAALNDSGHYAAKVESAHPPAHGAHNLLPEDYAQADEGEDPWVREADQK
jgi:hypothetical protein